MTKSTEADFRAKLKAAPESVRKLYRVCRTMIRLAKENGDDVLADADTFEEARLACELLSHPRNGFTAYPKPADESPGGTQFGAGRPTLVIALAKPAAPPKTAKEMFDKKKAAIKAREAKLAKMLAKAPKTVQEEFRRCQAKIKEFFDTRWHSERMRPFEETLYAAGDTRLTETEIVMLRELLRLEGWSVDLTAALNWRGKGRRPIELRFRNDSEG